MRSEQWPIAKLSNWDKNPRSITKKDFERLKRQIKKLGVYKPLICTPEGVVLGGNMRLRAIKDLGFSEAWVSVVEPKTEAQKLEIALSDNDRAGYYDDDLLAELAYTHKDEFDLADFSVDMKEAMSLDDLVSNYAPSNEKDDEVPEPPKDPISKRGDLYILGEHRLLCGDSTSEADVARLMDGAKADMVFTDPPYNLGFKYNLYSDNKTDDEYKEFCISWFKNLNLITSKIIITPGTKNLSMWLNMHPVIQGIAIWIKKNWTTSCKISNLQQWEPILFFGPFKRMRKSDLYEINRTYQNDVGENHTCPKQIELLCEIFKHYAGDSVLDVFGGSGSTMIACEKLNRKCYMSEIDPAYVDVIVKRWEDFTGKKATKEETAHEPQSDPDL